MGKKITAKMERFCKEYLVDHNATQAAIRAGYSKNTAKEIASENLSKLNIQERIAQLTKPITKKLELTAEKVLTEISHLAFSNIKPFIDEGGNIVPIHKLKDSDAAAISSLDVDEITAGMGKAKVSIGTSKKMKFHNKLKALELLGSHLSLFKSEVADPYEGQEPSEEYL